MSAGAMLAEQFIAQVRTATATTALIFVPMVPDESFDQFIRVLFRREVVLPTEWNAMGRSDGHAASAMSSNRSGSMPRADA